MLVREEEIRRKRQWLFSKIGRMMITGGVAMADGTTRLVTKKEADRQGLVCGQRLSSKG